MRALLVSGWALCDTAEASVYGIITRLRMFVDAARQLSDELDLLAFVTAKVDLSEAGAEHVRQTLRAFWGGDINFFPAPRQQPRPFLRRWNSYGAAALSMFAQDSFVSYSGAEQVGALEACLGRNPDWVFAHRLTGMCPLLRTKRPLPPVFFDLDDIEHVRAFRRLTRQPERPTERLKLLQVPALARGECRAVRRAARTFVCSELDRAYLSRRWGLPNVVTAENAIAAPTAPAAEAGGAPTLLFLGNLFGQFNRLGADYLVATIWPLVRQAVPEATLIIAGPHPENVKSYAAPPAGVHFSGFVEDLAALYRRATVVVCPILAGAGTRVKIIEAAAHGKAVVSTTIGAEGLAFADGQEIVLRDGPTQFAEACVRLLTDPAERGRLGAAARAAAVRLYDRQAVIEKIKREIRAGLEEMRVNRH